MLNIIIKSIEDKTSTTGKAYRRIEDGGGAFYSCWFGEIPLEEGKAYSVDIQQKGAYKNITSATEVSEQLAEQIATAPPAPVQVKPPEPTEKVAPQELGMWLKCLSDLIGSDAIKRDFPNAHVKIKDQFYKKMEEKTGIIMKGG